MAPAINERLEILDLARIRREFDNPFAAAV
jgi:hypothetical protein